jgi:multicomponent Na+:H+ antiporter subunit G
MLVLDLLSLALVFTGTAFFIAGTAGLVRFPDLFTSLHALSKADNLGLGLVVMGLVIRVDDFGDAFKLLLIWVMAMFSASTTCHLIARKALRNGVQPWQR